MPRVNLTQKFILERRLQLIVQLHDEGWNDSDIGEMFGLDRTWVYRMRKGYIADISTKRKKVQK